MPILVALTGLCGVGKSTAATELKAATGGEIIYLGSFVLDELQARGLPRTAENEKVIRMDIRSREGIAGLALRAVPSVLLRLDAGTPVILDAIFAMKEYDVLQKACGASRSKLLAITSSFETRCARLICRRERPFSRQEIERRDEIEIAHLGTENVKAFADYSIENEASEDVFKAHVRAVWNQMVA